MKPAQFEYFDPGTLDEALKLLRDHGDDAKVLAGGQSLVPLMNFRLARPKVIVDVNKIPGLDYVRDVDGMIHIGALTRQRTVETSSAIKGKCPLLTEATYWVGHLAIRTRGTVGGTIAHADPAAEYPCVLSALGGQVVVKGPAGERVLTADDFFVTFLTTALQPTEMVTEVRFPTVPPEAGWAFVEFSRRHGDFAIVGVAAMVQLDKQRKCTDARIALCGVGGTPFKARSAEAILKGTEVTDKVIQAAAEKVGGEVEPEGDLHGSAEYRKHLAKVLTGRTLRKALEKAGKVG
ncbi:MAG TPA: xanthine dehydrogenase family protein subunit M [Candidatus Sulfotelmatobacter sp.]|nr:xanthine dehydrogenase family protein subunit M [Candidatus Sulfotelmatobacter sp.]